MSDENKRDREWIKKAYQEQFEVIAAEDVKIPAWRRYNADILNRDVLNRIVLSLKKCSKCSYENSKDAIFCVKCGERLDYNADVIIKKNYKVRYLEEKVIKMTKKEFEELTNRPQISKDYYNSLLARPNVTKEEYEEIKKKANMTIWQRIKDQYSDEILGWTFVLIIPVLSFVGILILADLAIEYVGELLGLAKGWKIVASLITASGLYLLFWKYYYHSKE